MLEGRTVLVTGGATGLGRSIARAAAARGALVVVTALREDDANRVAGEIGAENGAAAAIACDVTRQADVCSAISFALKRYGRLDSVVHSATSTASGGLAAIEEVGDGAWDDNIAVSLTALFHLARDAYQPLKRVAGSMLVLTSTAGFKGAAMQSAYAAVKGAQRGFVKSLAREWGPDEIRVNALSPSALTPALAGFLHGQPAMRSVLLERAALRRLGDPDGDIAPAACFLLGQDAAFVTGQTLTVDGGALML